MDISSAWFYRVPTIMPAQTRWQILSFWLKRSVDIVGSVILLVLLTPLMLVIALAIRLDTPGPVFFVQQRVGSRRRRRNGQIFWEVGLFSMLKFRSMIHNADQSLHQQQIKAFVHGLLPPVDGKPASFKLQNDPRITRVGYWIRKLSLDELPQLFNVLSGEMSLVGPRPVPAYEAAEYQPWHRERLAALPGITGLWQIQGRSQVSFDEMIQLDIDYVRKQSLWLDMVILVGTIPAVLSSRGAG